MSEEAKRTVCSVLEVVKRPGGKAQTEVCDLDVRTSANPGGEVFCYVPLPEQLGGLLVVARPFL